MELKTAKRLKGIYEDMLNEINEGRAVVEYDIEPITNPKGVNQDLKSYKDLIKTIEDDLNVINQIIKVAKMTK